MQVDKRIIDGLLNLIKDELFNEKWITIHPHGSAEDENGKRDYRRIKLEDGETPKEAIERVYGKNDKNKKDKEEKKEKSLSDMSVDELKAKKKALWTDLMKKYNNPKDPKKVIPLAERKQYLADVEKIDEILKGKANKDTKDVKKVEKPVKEVKKEEKKTENKMFEKFRQLSAEAKTLKEDWAKKTKEFEKLRDENAQYNKLNKEIKELEAQRNALSWSTQRAEWNEVTSKISAKRKELLAILDEIGLQVGTPKAASEWSEKNWAKAEERKALIENASKVISKQLGNNSTNDALVEKFNKLENEEYIKHLNEYKKHKEEYKKLENELYKHDFYSAERVEIRKKMDEIHTKMSISKKEKNKLAYEFGLKVGKLLKTDSGLTLNTNVENPKLNDLTEKLHKTLDGVIPAKNFNNAEIKIRRGGARAQQSGSTIEIHETESFDVAIHETMHHLEEHSPEVLVNSLAFAMYRTGDEKQKSLKKLTGKNYKASEHCKADHFFDPYCGKIYDTLGGKNKSYKAADGSEIMSMGVQRLYTDPIGFAKEDREYFNFVIANLRGEVWS